MQFPNTTAITLHDCVVGIIAIVYFIKNYSNLTIRNLYRRQKTIIVFILIAVISLCVNFYWLTTQQFVIALLYLLRWIGYASIYFVVRQFPQQDKRITTQYMVYIGAIIVLIGYIQLAFYSNLRNLFYLGWDEHMYRMFSVFFDPNYLGSFLVLYFLFLLGHIFKTKEKKILILLFLFLTFLAIFLTFSRSALLMLIIGSFTFFSLVQKKHLIIPIIISLVILVFIASSRFSIENINLLRTVSSFARIESSVNALQIMQQKPLLGVGFNTYRYAQIKYKLRGENPNIVSHADAGSDNSFLFVGATTGIIGLSIFIFMLTSFIRYSYAVYRKDKIILAVVVCASLLSLIGNSMFINSLFYPFIMYWIWTILGLIESK